MSRDKRAVNSVCTIPYYTISSQSQQQPKTSLASTPHSIPILAHSTLHVQLHRLVSAPLHPYAYPYLDLPSFLFFSTPDPEPRILCPSPPVLIHELYFTSCTIPLSHRLQFVPVHPCPHLHLHLHLHLSIKAIRVWHIFRSRTLPASIAACVYLHLSLSEITQHSRVQHRVVQNRDRVPHHESYLDNPH